jgi:anthranilate synthase/aminodeoxychorismate synthase-like glutamine amidotransferase
VILLLDNYDSFVHNLARYFRRLGCPTRVIRSDQIDVATCESLAPDAVVISPGPRRPRDAGCSVEVVQRLSPRIPILGVCLGHQAIGVALGGSVTRCGPVHGMSSTITHDGKGIFASCPSPLGVGRYHSLAIDPDRVPDELEVTATSDDGVIMGVRHRTRPLFGVQFHPESVLTDDGLLLLRNFVAITQSATRETQRAPAGGETVS